MRTEERIAIAIGIGTVSLNLYAFPTSASLFEAMGNILKYFSFSLAGNDFFSLFFLFGYGFLVWVFCRAVANYISLKIFRTEFTPAIAWHKLRKILGDCGRGILVIALVSLPFTILLENLNYAMRYAGKDLVLWHLDDLLLHGQSFLVLPFFFHHALFTYIFWGAYASLPLAIGGIFIFLFIHSRHRTFRTAILSFILSIPLSFPLFASVPCQDPGNFYLKNLRGNTFPSYIVKELKTYSANPETLRYIAQLETSETVPKKDSSVPISCFPSMHAVWAILCCLFIWDRGRYIRVLATLWLITLLLGGLYLAQHYVIDYIVAIPIAGISFAIARILLKKELGNGLNGKNVGVKNQVRETFLP